MDLFDIGNVHEIALFQQRVWLGKNHVVSFSDGARTGSWHPGLTHWLARRFPDIEVPPSRYAQQFGDDPCHRWVMDVRDFLWAEPVKMYPKLEMKGSTWFPDAAWLIARAKVSVHSAPEGTETQDPCGSGSAVFAAKGGHNGESHNHNDLGTFLLHADVIQISLFERQDVLALDLSTAYAVPGLRSLTRTFLWEKRGSPCLTMEDRFVQTDPPQTVLERFVSFLEPEIREGDVFIRGERACLRIHQSIPGFLPVVHSEVFSGHRGEPETLWKIEFSHPAPETDCLFRAVFDWVD